MYDTEMHEIVSNVNDSHLHSRARTLSLKLLINSHMINMNNIIMI